MRLGDWKQSEERDDIGQIPLTIAIVHVPQIDVADIAVRRPYVNNFVDTIQIRYEG